jgi:hypothetical protein
MLEAEPDPRAIVRLEGLGQLNNPMTSSEMEPAISRLVAQYLNQLHYRIPVKYDIDKLI